jgi:hypothetical protein
MAHVGGIHYIKVPGHTVDWEISGLQLTGNAEQSWLYAKDPLTFQADAWDFKIEPQSDVVYDIPAAPRDNDKCVIIGKSGDAVYYILVVRPAGDANTGIRRASYERAGAGYIPTGWVRTENDSIEIEIV